MELSEIPDIRGRFDCPRGWCNGYRMDHGGDGEAPTGWLHSGDLDTLPLDTTGGLSAVGAEQARYDLELRIDGNYDAQELRELAQGLRELAEQLDMRGVELDRLNA